MGNPLVVQAISGAQRGSIMLLAVAAVLLVLWALGFFAVHIGGAFIHILIAIAVIVAVLHFVRGRRAGV